jgi:hypothetical protein
MGAARDCSLGGGVDLPVVDRAWAAGMTIDRIPEPANAARHD